MAKNKYGFDLYDPKSGAVPDWAKSGNDFDAMNVPNLLSAVGMDTQRQAPWVGGAQSWGERNTNDWQSFSDQLAARDYTLGQTFKNGAYITQVFDKAGNPVGKSDISKGSSFMEMLAPVMIAAGGPLASYFGGGMTGGALAGASLGGVSGGINAAEHGQNFLTGAFKGAGIGGLTGGIAGSFGTGTGQFDVGGSLGFSDPGLIKFANSAAGTIGKSLVTGSNPTMGLIGNAAMTGLGMVGGTGSPSLPGGDTTAAMPMDQIAAMDGGTGMGDEFDWNDWISNQLDTGSFMQSPGINWNDYYGGDASALLGAGQWDFSPDGLFQQAADQALASSGNVYNLTPEQLASLDAQNAADMGAGGGLSNFLKSLGGMGSSAANSLGGIKNLLPLLGAAAGAASGGGTTTATTQNKMDPRLEAYLYGDKHGDPNSLFGAAWNQFQSNPTGINPTMQQGLDLQHQVLTDPAYGQTYTGMRDLGQRLMAAPVAGNPFTSGGFEAPTAHFGGGNVGDLINQGRGLLDGFKLPTPQPSPQLGLLGQQAPQMKVARPIAGLLAG